MFGLDAISGIVKTIGNVAIVKMVANLANESVFHFNAFTLLLIAVCLCAIASIILRIIPKKSAITTTSAPSIQVPMTNIPLDYQEYLKHKAYDAQFNNDEKFTFSKFFSGFVDHRNYAKAIVLGIIMLVILVIGYSTYKEVKNLFVHTPPVVSTITNTGGGTVTAKTESKSEHGTSNGLNLGIFNNWF